MEHPFLGTIETLADLIANARIPHGTHRICIDGCGGSGKSTLADSLRRTGVVDTVVRMDDFYHSSHIRETQVREPGDVGSDFDWRRLRDDVLIPLTEGRTARYQRYDWPTDSLAEWHTVLPTEVVVVEGVYSCRSEIAQYFDIRIWVETPASVRLARGIARDGVDATTLWRDVWMPAEDEYVRTQHPSDRAHLVLGGEAPADSYGNKRYEVIRLDTLVFSIAPPPSEDSREIDALPAPAPSRRRPGHGPSFAAGAAVP